MAIEQPMDVDDDTDEFEFDEGGQHVCGDIYIPPPPRPTGIEDGRRLVITRIEIHNFKSYGGTQVLGPFHKCFTSVVGPNGSGKSNVIDALLFVFGYRAHKLRLKKLSLLIHNSNTYPNCTSCSVKVFFALIYDKIPDEMDIIEGSEFTISRVAHKDNSSYYCIDDRRVQFRQVSNLLQSHGVDLRYNRFLILQGEVEQISLMKPKAEDDGETGMLEFLEDIIGTTRLKEPIDKINRRVNELNELRAEKVNRCKFVQKERDALESVKNEAIAYLKMENLLMKKQACLFGKQKQQSLEVFMKAESEFKEAENQLNEAMKGLDGIRDRYLEKQKEYDDINSSYEAICKNLEALNERYKVLEKEGEQNRCKNTNTFEKGKKILADKTAVEEMLKEAIEKLPQLEAKMEEEIKKKQELQEEYDKTIKEIEKQTSTLEDVLAPLRKSKGDYEAKLVSMSDRINSAKSAVDVEKSKFEIYMEKERHEKSRLISLESDLKSNIAKLEEKRKLIESCASDLPESERRIEENLKRAAQLEEERKRIEIKLNQENQTLMDAKSFLRERESRNRVLTKIMEQKRSGAISGIYGRLGDLATIDKKYDIAISTICGNQLDKILTDCPKTSSLCIDYLKKNNIGVATFSALDQKQKFRHADFDFNYPAERLIDLIEVQDEKFIPAFSDLLRDTLVVENSDLANKIAFSGRGWTVVTLQGHIYRSYGVMTGGGRPVQGKMRITSDDRRTSLAAGMSDDDVQNLEKEVQRLRQDLANTTAQCEKLQQEAAQAKKDNNFIRYQLPTLQMEIEELGKIVEGLQNGIIESKQRIEQVKPDPKMVEQFESSINELQQKYDQVKDEARVHEDQIANINREIEALIGEKLGPANKREKKLKKEIEELTTSIAKADSGQKGVTRTIDKCKEKIAEYKKEVIESNALLAELKTRRHEIRDELDSIDKQRETVKTEREEFSEKVKLIQKDMSKLKDEESEFQASNLDLKHQVELLQKQVEDKRNVVRKWDSMIDELKPNELEGIDLNDDKDKSSEDAMDEDLDIKDLKKSIEKLDQDIKKIKPNLNAIEEFKQKHALFIERSKEVDEVTRKRDEHRDVYESVKNMRMNEFKQGFQIINNKLKEMYRMITLGGDADLEFCDSSDPFIEGVVFSVRPNKKTWKRISNLSGGEKTLSSLALIFALHYYKPSPLYVMDEIDAALDFKNVSIVGNYIKDRTKNTQFLIISLRNNMYELSNRLIGIYKTYNSTKSVAYSLS